MELYPWSVPASALTGLTPGAILYGESDGTLAQLADVATGQVVVSGGAGLAPAYSGSPAFPTWQSLVTNGAGAVGHIIDGPSYTTSGAKLLSVRNNGVEKVFITKDGQISANGSGGVLTEVFGNGALASAAGGHAFGSSANASGSQAMAFGRSTTASVTDAIVFGMGATNSGGESTVVGSYSVVSGTACVAIGLANAANGNANTQVGHGVVSTGFQGCTLLGRTATATANNQFIVGGPSAALGFISASFIGNGVTATVPQNVMHNATGGSGANVAGASYGIAGGRSTGTGLGGPVTFNTSKASASSSTANALVERGRFDSIGNLLFNETATPTSAERVFVLGNASVVDPTTFSNQISLYAKDATGSNLSVLALMTEREAQADAASVITDTLEIWVNKGGVPVLRKIMLTT